MASFPWLLTEKKGQGTWKRTGSYGLWEVGEHGKRSHGGWRSFRMVQMSQIGSRPFLSNIDCWKFLNWIKYEKKFTNIECVKCFFFVFVFCSILQLNQIQNGIYLASLLLLCWELVSSMISLMQLYLIWRCGQ